MLTNKHPPGNDANSWMESMTWLEAAVLIDANTVFMFLSFLQTDEEKKF
jgi:hypothetical protein